MLGFIFQHHGLQMGMFNKKLYIAVQYSRAPVLAPVLAPADPRRLSLGVPFSHVWNSHYIHLISMDLTRD